MSPSKKPFPIGSADQPKSDPKQQPIGFEYTEKRHCGLPYPASGQRSRPSVALHVCLLTGAPRRQRPGHCPLFHAPIPPVTPRRRPATSKGVGGDSLAHRPMAVALPESRSPVPPPAIFGAPLPAMLLVSRRWWGPVIGREWRRIRPVIAPRAGDPTPIRQVKVRTRAKSRVSIETRQLWLSSWERDFPEINIPTHNPDSRS